MESLTDLEAVAVGCVFRNQPCTAHFVRTRFRNSPSVRFSDSAGSVYPMMKRLQNRRLLTSRLSHVGKRRVRYYECTTLGRSALRRWIGPPLPSAASVSIDPLRTRMLYLELLSPHRRSRWLDEAEQALRKHLEQVQLNISNQRSDKTLRRDVWLALAHENARVLTLARLKWLKVARRRLKAAGRLDRS